jgi:tetratricopeptide (TPR) repeat protein
MVLEIEGKVETSRLGTTSWASASTNQVLNPGDRLRTGERSRAVVRLSPLTTIRADELTLLRIPGEPKKRGVLGLLRGVIYFFHRDRPEEFPVQTPTMWAVIRGTDFNLRVAEDGASTLTMLAGEVEMTNQFGRLTLKDGEQGVAPPGQSPTRTAVIQSQVLNVIQWCLYYPGALDPDEVTFSAEEQQALGASISACRAGDLLAALAQYPAGRQPASNGERIYLAALLLSVGRVEQAETLLNALAPGTGPGDRSTALGEGLRMVIAAVKFQSHPATVTPTLATSLLAESYYQQSRSQLEAALTAARRATERSPGFGFAWARVAELEFSFGRIEIASVALEKALQLTPRNAQALALKGFLLAARNQTRQALDSFDQALALDGALGNAWLGRGLCRIHLGDAEAGRQDLQVAATVEPQRAVLRSYLGKAFSHVRNNAQAVRELELAASLDPRDPTARLYLALVRQQQNRVNEAVRDLEASQEQNDNRSVFRSRLLLDQDQAVRGANVATIYEDAGLPEVSLREAARAVSLDYANYSAHLFLADSFNALRDPYQISLRYETPWLSEYLVANLLAPASAGTLSPFVTQQEYARLFERNRLGLVSETEYLSRGAWFQGAAQYGIQENLAYAAEVAYRTDNGQRPNGDFEQTTTTLKTKLQLTPQNSVFFQYSYYEAEGGDLRQYYDQTKADPTLRVREKQVPILLAGYHHRWSPGIDTLLFAGLLDGTLKHQTSNGQSTLLLQQDNTGQVIAALPAKIGQDYRTEPSLYTVELQQMVQRAPHTFIVGGRFQGGDFETHNQNTITDGMVVNPAGFPIPASWFPTNAQHVTPDFDRVSLYGYYHLNVLDPLVLIAGVSYDRLTYPDNFRFAPISDGEDTTGQVSPKAGLVWTPWRGTTLRGAYTHSLGGVSYDQSFRLEPSQVAGFNQAFRSLIPESVAGANAAEKFETWGVALDQKFPTGTYVGVSGEWLESDVDRVIGTFDLPSPLPAVEPFFSQSGTPESLDYRERSLFVTLNQLLSDEWSVGVRYRLSRAELRDNFLAIPDTAATGFGFQPRQDVEATLHQVNLFALYNHPCGFFGQFESLWSSQSNQGYSPDIPGDDFWQFNVYAGYRFPRRQAEVRLGLLNLTDRDYQLNPLNLHPELPRSRTLLMSLRFNF